VQPSPGQDSSHHQQLSRPVEDLEDAPRLLGFATYVWTIPTQVVQM
jgi:hypothetical protein